MSTPTASLPADLQARLPGLLLRDQARLQRRIDRARRDPAALERIAADVAAAEQRVARRRASVPAITYPQALPIAQRKDDILAAIRDHQVVVVAGETGSGKTTQLPKILLELGRGITGTIGHTQPRRLAARTVAERIAEELGTPLGTTVGYKVRFTDRVGEDSLVKVMTDGILLAELEQDRALRQYDTLIIDEAHERSLNVDFILGYLKQLLPRRPDLKVIITSATIDPHRFAAHFGVAPVIEVSGRTYPVEVRYRQLVAETEDEQDRDQTAAIIDAVEELSAEGPGDVLVFLSGEREIRDTADAIRDRRLRDVEVLPLYARLSAAEQHRVFQSHASHRGRRIVLATNVAETSLTVPGIRYVVDPGTARMSRWSHRTKVQRLPIEPISRASADQRKGRCGRTADGICIRLYGEDDFDGRPAFTDPEILRTDLAAVILQMAALKLGDIAAFPFLDAPDQRAIKDGVQLLEELGALEDGRLTPLGRRLASLPIDPRLARMVLEAERNGAVAEVLVIAAALSIQDPRERPGDHQQAADEAHTRFADERSDFLTWLNLWNELKVQQRERSSNQFRRWCRDHFLSHLRIREWQDVHAQLREQVKGLGMTVHHDPADADDVHRSVLAGLLSHIGLRDGDPREFQGARGVRFAVFPGSVLARRPPRWVMAAELVETSRLWGRVAARIEPEWVEPLAAHLVKRTYSEPRWDRTRGSVVADERVTLYGVPIITGRRVQYGRIDPGLSRELFLRHALVEGEWDGRHAFLAENRRLLAEVQELEHRVRRRDIVADDATLFAFYDARVPADVVSARHFDRWWRRAAKDDPGLLTFDRALLLGPRTGAIRPESFPGMWAADGLTLPLSYRFEPGADDDGVTVTVPLGVLNRLTPEPFGWHVPGLREELVTALLRGLPKDLRRSVVPVPDHARAFLAAADPGRGSLTDALAAHVRRSTGVVVPRDAWRPDRLPAHLRVTFRVVDDRGRVIGQGDDLAALRGDLAPRMRAAVAAAHGDLERTGLRDWPPAALPRAVAEGAMRGYPALVDQGDSVGVRVLATEPDQLRAMWGGTRRLLRLTVPSPAKVVRDRVGTRTKLALSRSRYRDVADLLDDCIAAAVDDLLDRAGGPSWDREGFAALRETVAAGLADAVLDVIAKVEVVLTAAGRVEDRLDRLTSEALAPAVADLRAQLAGLVHRGFVSAAGRRRLPDLVRYLRAMDHRMDKLASSQRRDRDRMLAVQELQRSYLRLLAAAPPSEELRAVRWMIEELRVSLFAQPIGTPQPISEQRVDKAMAQLGG